MDTPGILWPKLDDEHTGLCLAFTGAIRDEIMDTETLGCKLMEMLAERAGEALSARYGITAEMIEQANSCQWPGYELLKAAGRRRGFLIARGEIDTERMAKILLDEFRAAKLGRITLELPPDRGGRRCLGKCSHHRQTFGQLKQNVCSKGIACSAGSMKRAGARWLALCSRQR